MSEHDDPTGRRRVRAPLRLGLGGGGTDLDEYSRRHGGYLVAATIGWYVRVGVAVRPPGPGWAPLPADRSAAAGVEPAGQVWTSSDVTGGSGLGSSGALAAALAGIEALRATGRMDRAQVAEAAYRLERRAFTPNAGRQDTLAAVYGGLREYEIGPGGVRVAEIRLDGSGRARLERELLLLDTTIRRSADQLLRSEATRLSGLDDGLRRRLDRTKELGRLSAELLRRGALDEFGELLHESWAVKRARTPG